MSRSPLTKQDSICNWRITQSVLCLQIKLLHVAYTWSSRVDVWLLTYDLVSCRWLQDILKKRKKERCSNSNVIRQRRTREYCCEDIVFIRTRRHWNHSMNSSRPSYWIYSLWMIKLSSVVLSKPLLMGIVCFTTISVAHILIESNVLVISK
jgi:hypothetical protein